jgi:hypothetical protein
MKDFASQIYDAVVQGKLKEPFGPSDVREACPGWNDRTYSVFLPKHRVGNPGGETELFEQVGEGLYRTLPSLQGSLSGRAR